MNQPMRTVMTGSRALRHAWEIDDDLFAQALGTGGADIVHAERFDHGGADVAGHAAERADRHDEHRQRHIVDLVEERTEAGEVIARRLHAEDRSSLSVTANSQINSSAMM